MKYKKKIKLLEARIKELELEVFGGYEIEFIPDPYLLDPNKEVREDILSDSQIAAGGGEWADTGFNGLGDEDGK
jgi:hypothetical protein